MEQQDSAQFELCCERLNAYLLEANPNPQIASDEDFASAAEAAGIEYPELIEQLIRFEMSYDPERMIM